MPRRSVSFTGQRVLIHENALSSNETASIAAGSRLDGETGVLPEVRFFHRWSPPLPEKPGPALERRPVGPDRWAGTEVRTGDLEDVLVGQFVGHEDALVRVADHERHGADDRRRDLQRRRILSLHETACFVDVQLRTGP